MDRENEQRISLKCSLLCKQFEERKLLYVKELLILLFMEILCLFKKGSTVLGLCCLGNEMHESL